MSGQKVNLNAIRTSPFETAEQAVPRLLVYVFPVTGELLCTSKAFVTIDTDSLHPTAHITTVVALGGLDSYMPSGAVGPSLGHVSLHSDQGKPGNNYLVGLQVGLRPELEASKGCLHLCVGVVEVQR